MLIPLSPHLFLGGILCRYTPFSFTFFQALVGYLILCGISLLIGVRSLIAIFFFITHILLLFGVYEPVQETLSSSNFILPSSIVYGFLPLLSILFPLLPTFALITKSLEARFKRRVDKGKLQPVEAIKIPTELIRSIFSFIFSLIIPAIYFVLISGLLPTYKQLTLSLSLASTSLVIFGGLFWSSYYAPRIDNPINIVQRQFESAKHREKMTEDQLEKADRILYFDLLHKIKTLPLIKECDILNKILPILQGVRYDDRRSDALEALHEIAEYYTNGRLDNLLAFLRDFPSEQYEKLKNLEDIGKELEIKSPRALSMKKITYAKLALLGSLITISIRVLEFFL